MRRRIRRHLLRGAFRAERVLHELHVVRAVARPVEGGLRRGGVALRVNAASTPDWFTARRLAEPVYGQKLLIDEDTDHPVLGEDPQIEERARGVWRRERERD